MDAEDLEALKDWMEDVQFSRANCLKNMTREFSDAVCAAEVLKHYIPKLVDMNMYHPVSAKPQKLNNWQTLNKKCFAKLGCEIPKVTIDKVVNNAPGYVEMIMRNMKLQVEKVLRGDLIIDAPDEKKGGKGKKGKKGKSKKNVKSHLTPSGGADGGDAGSEGSGPAGNHQEEIVSAITMKDRIIEDYEEVVKTFQVKIKKMDILMRLKEKRIEDLERKCRENGIGLK